MQKTAREYAVVGAAFGLASHHPGCKDGPRSLLERGLVQKLHEVGVKVEDAGELTEPDIGSTSPAGKAKYVREVESFGNDLLALLGKLYRRGVFPILLGGDHSISIASVTAAAQHLRDDKKSSSGVGLLWIDAHPDINTPDSSPSGNVHGMSVAALLGYGDSSLVNLGGFSPKLAPENVVYIGLRDVDPGERERIHQSGIKAYTMKDIDLLGIGKVCQQSLEYLERVSSGFVLSFDLDVCEPEVAPGVGTPVRGGLTVRESHLIMELAAQSNKLMSIELVELNPALDEHDTTKQFAIWLLQSAVGKTIL